MRMSAISARVRPLRVAVPLAASIGLLLSTGSGTAQADTTADPATACPFSRTLCLFDQPDYNGARFTAQSLNPPTGVCVDLVEHGWGGTRARSAVNNAPQTPVLFAGSDCTGSPLPLSGNGLNASFTFDAKSVIVH